MSPDSLLSEITNLLQQDLDRRSKAKAVAEAIRAQGGYRWTGLYDVDLQRGIVSNVAWSGADAPAYPTFSVTKGLTSRAIAEKKTVNVGDVTRDSDYLTALSTTRSEIIVPVLDATDSYVIGTLDIESELPEAFDAVAQGRLEECALVLKRFWNDRVD
jgi:L-methionine (R)-S-oxide reductase